MQLWTVLNVCNRVYAFFCQEDALVLWTNYSSAAAKVSVKVISNGYNWHAHASVEVESMDIGAELKIGYEELNAAMRRGSAAVLELARSFMEQGAEAERQGNTLRAAALYQLAGDCYLTVYVNMRSARYEPAMLMLVDLAKGCYVEAARIYEELGEVECATNTYRKLINCMHRERQCRINYRNVDIVTKHLSQRVKHYEEKIKRLEFTSEREAKCFAVNEV